MLFAIKVQWEEILLKVPNTFTTDRKTVCVQGLGFVGAAMALAVATARGENNTPRYNVIGIDLANTSGYQKVESINKGIFPFDNNDSKLLKAMEKAHGEGNLWATTDSSYFSLADIVVVDVNLDINYDAQGEPVLDLSMFEGAIRTLGQYISEETLVIVETTVPPGTCEKIVWPILKEEFAKRNLMEAKVYVAHSYERVMPGRNYYDSIVNYWRVYSGVNDASADRCEAFLTSVISTKQYPLTRLQGTTATEIAKVLENSYRATTIAFIEEWGRFAEAIGVDLFEVIQAIRMRPTHSNIRQPGFGVGGYCLTKDPYFAKLAAKNLFDLQDMAFPFCTMAVQTNRVMPLVSLSKIERYLGTLLGKQLLVFGVSYRQDVGDTRYSPTEVFVKEAQHKGAIVVCQDPLVSHWQEMNMDVIQNIPDLLGYDVIIFAVQHEQYKIIDFETKEIGAGTLILDANNVLNKEQRDAIVRKKGVQLISIGRG